MDSRVIYETDSGMTNMIEGKLTADSEQMTKSSLEHEHEMTWEYLHENDTNPPMQLTVRVFLDKSKEVRIL